MKNKNNLWSILSLFGGSEDEKITNGSLDGNSSELYNDYEKSGNDDTCFDDNTKELEE